MPPELRVGYAQQVITPDLSETVYLAGFGRNRVATEVHDHLYARSLAISSGDRVVILTALDLIGLTRNYTAQIRRSLRATVGGADLVAACTHTHHGPDTIGLWGPDDATTGVSPGYQARLPSAVVATCLGSLQRMVPATVRSATARAPRFVHNTRTPDVVDDEITCVQFVSTRRHALATLLIYPCHPEVVGRDNTQISADYPGYLRRRVEEEVGAPCLFFAGALGGMLTPRVSEHTFAAAQEMAEGLAEVVAQALSRAPIEEGGILHHAIQEFAVPLQNPLLEAAMAAGLLPGVEPVAATMTTEASLTTIGSTVLLGVPGELLPSLGLRLKEELLSPREGAPPPRTVGIVGLANDEVGYILPADEYVYPEDPLHPGEHYEETMSIGPEAGPRLMEAARVLIRG